MAPAERALLLAVSEIVQGQYLGHPTKYNALAKLITAVEAEAEKPSEPVKTCRTCRFNDGDWCRAPVDGDCISPDLSLWEMNPLSAAQYSNDRIDNKS